jgi:thiamine-phosphate diphosphorylase
MTLLYRLYISVSVAFCALDGSHGFIRLPLSVPELISSRGGALHSCKTFPDESDPPFLAIITEPNACDCNENMESTLEAIRRATSNQQVDLVSVRLTRTEAPDRLERALQLTRRLVQLSMMDNNNNTSFKVVCSSDFIETALQAKAHGIHVKEAHLSRIPEIREAFSSLHSFSPLIGTSSHSVESAMRSFETYAPDYYFVGTCYATASHPEKSVEDLEGPKLPGEIRRIIVDAKFLAIGGIDDSNCDEPIAFGADGVATIRAVLQADDPAEVVSRLQSRMKESLDKMSSR